MKSSFMRVGAVAVLAALALVSGCENTLIGERGRNLPPEVWLSSGPVEGDTTGYQVHFWWGGWDPDGEIAFFEFVIAAGNPIGFNQEDTTGLDKWLGTASHDSIFRVAADDSAQNVTIGGLLYTRYDKTHTFFLRAVDMMGKRSAAVYRSFTAWTLAPTVAIDRPRPPQSSIQTLSTVTTFGWTGHDPIDSPDNKQEPESIRYFVMQNENPAGDYDLSFDVVGDLNNNPARYEDRWGSWIWYRAEGDSGRSTIIGDDEDQVQLNRTHIFSVQAKDEAGAVTAIFDRQSNVRQFVVSKNAGPVLTVTEPFLGGFKFLGMILRPEKRDLPPGITLKFRWSADATSYGGEITCYQYGWDVADLNRPDEWDSDCSPYVRGCTATWYSGVHTLFVRVVDNIGSVTLGQIEINVVPFTMERNLLWVDDFPSEDFDQISYALPTESEHDTLWVKFCRRAVGFDPERDVYDVYHENSGRQPLISLIGKYKNIIWTYSSAVDMGAWDNVVRFTPESAIVTSQVAVNYLSIYLAKGGHLLTEGSSERGGGLAACMPMSSQVFPMSIKCEAAGIEYEGGCAGDTSGVNSYPYKDYCVQMLDKVLGVLRSQLDDESYIYLRRVKSYDCMANGYRTTDAWHTRIPGFPSRLDLWSKVTESTSYFYLYPSATDSRPGGFTLLESYDPAYWMTAKNMKNQSCFHPMFRMRARNTSSVLDRTTIALFVTKYADIVPSVESGIAVPAASFHIGLELWYFNRAQIDSIMNTILREWQILAQ